MISWVEPDSLRVFLFAGLLVHKLVWESLKRTSRSGSRVGRAHPPLSKRIVKSAKMFFLGFLMVQALFLEILPLSQAPGYLQMSGTALFILGFTMSIVARLQLGRNWTDLEDAKVLERHALVTRGIYRYVRHPIYGGDLMLLIGLELALNSWLVFLAVIPLVVVIKSVRREEAQLAEAFNGYSAYVSQSKRFIPFVV
ncbi:MAG: isoprenylcysteine carboxylmethyltransferase family protein [Acidobacteria bacterium]|nr:MAG: isoprenylcysteine carboxylmethyltransferase family protein [Acidobacteriota bacterium]